MPGKKITDHQVHKYKQHRNTLTQVAAAARASKTDVRIIDFVDTGHPALLRMWDKRERGYRAMGYRIGSEDPE